MRALHPADVRARMTSRPWRICAIAAICLSGLLAGLLLWQARQVAADARAAIAMESCLTSVRLAALLGHLRAQGMQGRSGQEDLHPRLEATAAALRATVADAARIRRDGLDPAFRRVAMALDEVIRAPAHGSGAAADGVRPTAYQDAASALDAFFHAAATFAACGTCEGERAVGQGDPVLMGALAWLNDLHVLQAFGVDAQALSPGDRQEAAEAVARLSATLRVFDQESEPGTGRRPAGLDLAIAATRALLSVPAGCGSPCQAGGVGLARDAADQAIVLTQAAVLSIVATRHRQVRVERAGWMAGATTWAALSLGIAALAGHWAGRRGG